MMVSKKTLEVLAETSETAKEVVAEWGYLPENDVAFLASPDCDDLHISMVDNPLIVKRMDIKAHASVTKVRLAG